jgi:hypothetical protein
MNITRTKEELKSLTRVANNSSLARIFLLNSNVSRTINVDTLNEVHGKIDFNGELKENNEGFFDANVSFSVKGLTEDDVVVIEISCDFLLNYEKKPDSELTEEDISNFCNTNALYNAWPFIREFVHSTCNRMEIPSITLPLLKIVPPKRAKKEPDQEQLTTEKTDK